MCMFDDMGCVTLRETNPVARKTHFCGECGRQISSGERYRRIVVVCDGRLDTNVECAHCEWGVRWLMLNCHGYLFGGVLEDLQQHVQCGAVPPFGAVARTCVGMKRRWRSFNGAGLMAVPA